MKSCLNKIISIFILTLPSILNAQNNVGIGTISPHPTALLDLTATDKGVLIPRMTTMERMTIPSPAFGLLVFDVNTGSFWFYNGVSAAWVEILSGTVKTLADADGNTKIQVEKNPDEDIIRFDLGGIEKMVLRKNVNGQERLELGANTAIGTDALFSNSTGVNNSAFGNGTLKANTTGSKNTASGFLALNKNTTGKENTAIGNLSLHNNLTGSYNTAIGDSSLVGNTLGNQNTAVGNWSLQNNSTGADNTGIGINALLSNSSGNYNTAIGSWSLSSNSTANYNTAIGNNAMYSNTIGTNNTAIGHLSLRSNTTGNHNTSIGKDALYNNSIGTQNTSTGLASLYTNTIGTDNTANGAFALHLNTTGNYNTALGSWSLYSNTTANRNTAVGNNAMYSLSIGTDNTAVGGSALRSTINGNNNTALGFESAVNGNHAQSTFVGSKIDISTNRTNVSALGYGILNAQCTNNNQILLGNTAIGQIRAQVTGITAYSDARFKTNVSNDVKGLEFITRLNPVTYNENPEVLHQIWGTPDSVILKIDHSDVKSQRFIGFLAQDVEQAARECGFEFPGIDVPENEREVYSLRYVDFIMPMVKSIQEQQMIIDTLKNQNQELKSKIDKLNGLEAEVRQIKVLLVQMGKQTKL